MNKTILIVDDDSKNTFALSAVLRSRQFNCTAVASMVEAFAALQSDKNIGIILMDMMMPGMDGYESIPILKGMDEYAQIPIIAVTAQAMTGDRERCLATGADDYLSKPVDVDKLISMINQYVV
ncbi:MAG: response regulator [Chitinophagaceae bacterium]|nr:MAG: response regulator [Chitinophagaceae bacterium]